MLLREIQPFIRHVQLLIGRKGEYSTFTRSYDCRLFYVYRGRYTMTLPNEQWHLERGDLVVWQPNTEYRMTIGEDGVQLLCVNFDYTRDFQALDYPIPPDQRGQFDPARSHGQVQFQDAVQLNRPILVRRMQAIEDTLLEMKLDYQQRKIFWRERISGLMTAVLSQIARSLSLNVEGDGRYEHRIDEIIAYIQEHFSEDLTNAELGKHFNYHPNYLNRQMLLYTEKTLHQYLITQRIRNAIELLECTDLPISAVAEQVGYGDICHFSKVFKQKTGYCPSHYRRPAN
ncbi:MAG: AraC family transcriptional regulator [Clostridia bacterium]